MVFHTFYAVKQAHDCHKVTETTMWTFEWVVSKGGTDRSSESV